MGCIESATFGGPTKGHSGIVRGSLLRWVNIPQLCCKRGPLTREGGVFQVAIGTLLELYVHLRGESKCWPNPLHTRAKGKLTPETPQNLYKASVLCATIVSFVSAKLAPATLCPLNLLSSPRANKEVWKASYQRTNKSRPQFCMESNHMTRQTRECINSLTNRLSWQQFICSGFGQPAHDVSCSTPKGQHFDTIFRGSKYLKRRCLDPSLPPPPPQKPSSGATLSLWDIQVHASAA